MIRPDRVWVWVIVLVLTISEAIVAGCASADIFPPPSYSATEIRSVVVDEVTGRPLEGVVVVAQWILRRMGGDGPRLQVTEAVTDAQGQFLIPSWGPKPRPPLMQLTDKSPQLLVFKRGYAPLRLVSESKAEFIKSYPNYRTMTARQISERMSIEGNPTEPVQESFWDGMTIQLEPFRGTPERWLQLLESQAYLVTRDDLPQARAFLEAIKAERQVFNLSTLDPSRRASFYGLFTRLDDLLK
jgi:hypothetical protein